MTSESTLGALGKAPSNAPAMGVTLGGLGPRQRVKTGPGLGPDATRAVSGPTLVSASEEARSARDALNDELGLPLVGVPVSPPPAPVKPTLDARQIAQRFGNLAPGAAPQSVRREESVAMTLGEGDFVELESAPIHPAVPGLQPRTSQPPPPLDEDSLPVPEVPDEEITRVGSSPRAAPATAPTAFGAPRSPFVPTPAIGSYGAPFAPATPFAPPPPPAPLAPPVPPQATQVMQAVAAPTPAFGGFEPVPVSRSSPPVPLLIDVTPLTLAVETVNGFCDSIIERNTQVPCERERVFVTAADHQTLVRVRISQGESSRFGENTLLGEIELSGLSPAPRGEVQIAVSFSLDTNGMLNVSARELATGRVTATQVRLVALPEASDIARMTQRNAARQF
jgi:molecular chaperone DnaK